jgi:hypothetical protein
MDAVKPPLPEDCTRGLQRKILTDPLLAVAGFEVFRSGRF